MPGPLRGEAGAVRWGYLQAARVRDWTITRTPTGERTVSASVVEADPFRLQRQPLLFAAQHAAGEWRWPVLAATVTEGRLHATLGPPEP